MSMGPKYGTEEYKKQIEMIKCRLDDVRDIVDEKPGVIAQVLSLFIFDESFSRAAICQAEKEWKRDNGL